jgi:glutamate-1-semialdehyde aminotransferase
MKPIEKLTLENSINSFEYSKTLVPGGVLGIRRPYNFVEGEYPIFVENGKGGRIVDVDGNEYIDFLCAYGPIILGYREEEIDKAVIQQILEKGFCFSLTQLYQNELAEKLRELIPCADMSIFVKTGSDTTTLALRLARAYTSRTKVMRCGFHGWHDWCVEVKGGIPEKLYEDTYEFQYNDLADLERLLRAYGDDTAAIIITPFGHPLAKKLQSPKAGFLEGVRELADKYNVVLIFDEVRTGFRVSMGGAQAYYNVTPDLTCIGKAMANGYAIAAVCGKEEIMKKAESDVFVSSTFFPNSLGYIAALKTIEILQRDNVLEAIWKKGQQFMDAFEAILAKYDVGAELSGIPPMFFVTFKSDPEKIYRKRRNEFFTQLIRQGVFMQPYHHGYICYRHSEDDLKKTLKAVENSLQIVLDKYGKFQAGPNK